MLLEKLSINPQELAAINKLTLREYAENEVYSFSAKFIDDSVTDNGRIWSVEWQEKNVSNFIGKPVGVNHENDQRSVFGRIYHAEQKGNAIFGKIYVPLDTEVGLEARKKIESGLFKNVSLGARSDNTKQEGKHTRILPSENDWVFELSFVEVPGCRSCEVQKESACSCGQQCSCQSTMQEDIPPGLTMSKEALLEFATEERIALGNEFVRVAGLTLSINDKPLLYTVANSIPPKTLKAFSQKLREKYLAENKSQPEPATSDDAQRIRESLSNIRKVKGV
jgi:hypothetical protein